MEQHQELKNFISAFAEFTKRHNEKTSSDLQRALTAISGLPDLHIFDPEKFIALEFYISLNELMNSLDSNSALMWSALNALQSVCRNVAAKQALIHTYKFTPTLTRLLEENLTTEKRKKVLRLLQDLTYGIRISWEETYLPNLIQTLTQWVMQNKDEDIIIFSLGILVNVCYKNLIAVYSLMRTINTKLFIRHLIRIQCCNINIRVQCSKLLIILEQPNKSIPEKYILDFVSVTFETFLAALKNKDVLLLRHIIDFFNDVGQNEYSRSILITYPNYGKSVSKILIQFEDDCDPGYIALVFEFLIILVKLRLPSLINLYSSCIKFAMIKVSIEQACSKALALIRTIIIDSTQPEISSEILADLDPSVFMPIIIKDMKDVEKRSKPNVDPEKFSELMQLLQEMVKSNSIRIKIIEIFSEHLMKEIFRPLLSFETSKECWPSNLICDTSTSFYIHALALTANLAAKNSSWLTLYTELLDKKQVQMVIALGLFTGDVETKQKVLQLNLSTGYSYECNIAVAQCMRELEAILLLQSCKQIVTEVERKSNNCSGYERTSLYPFAQEKSLDILIEKLDNSLQSDEIGNISTSDIMEIYEFKLAAMKHTERAMRSSLEAASSHETSLKHRLAQMVAESSWLRKARFDMQQRLECTQQSLKNMQSEKDALKNQLQETRSESNKNNEIRLKEIEELKIILVDKTTKLEACTKENETLFTKLEDFEALKVTYLNTETQLAESTSRVQEMTKLLEKLQEAFTKKEQIMEEKMKELLDCKQEIEKLTKTVKTYEDTLASKDAEIIKMNEEVSDLSRMRDMIFQITAKKKDELS
ncbi:protein CIP2A homolog L [Prorops nasuta]|uniref:protein CIP2A homolog L n=1 Tax=Prorops nasuta TaxID=863751 RepID=UPI0034CDA1BF